MSNPDKEHPAFDTLAGMADKKAMAYLRELMDKAGINPAELMERSGMSFSTPYSIYGGRRAIMRDMVLQMAVGLRLTVPETDTLLTLFGFTALEIRQKRDAAIVYCLDHEYPFSQVQSFLAGLNMKTLG